MKKQQRKNDERVGFPDISDSQAVLLRGILMKIRIVVTICSTKRLQQIYDPIVWNLKFKQANEDDKTITKNKQREV